MMGLIVEDFHFPNILLNFTMKHKRIKDYKKKKEGKEKRRGNHHRRLENKTLSKKKGPKPVEHTE